MTAFADLMITGDDYVPSPENPEYFILDQALLMSLRAGFEQNVREVFPEDEWEIAEGEIPWDSGTMGVRVTQISKNGKESRRSFILDYGVLPSMSAAALRKKAAGGNHATVRARILINSEGDYSGVVCDHEWSGKGWYDPKRWAQEAYSIMTSYLNHGQIYSGY